MTNSRKIFFTIQIRHYCIFATLMLMLFEAYALDFITEEHQLSSKEKRVGEAYYREDMKWMIYQAEVSDDNPFYQIYLKNIASGDTTQVSPGAEKQPVHGFIRRKIKFCFRPRMKILQPKAR